MLRQEIEKRYREWLAADWLDAADRAELAALTDEAEINDRFYCDLEFGTGGMRGELGIGTNRMNIYLIRRLTQALADAVIEQGGAERGVAISYDSRRLSARFAEETALVLAANGVKAYLFAELRPTPVLSYAVRRLGAMAGVMVTASHNPKQYNGYKVYWEDGGQLPPEQADKIVAKMEQRASWDIAAMPREQAEAAGLLQTPGAELDDTYIAEVRAQMLNSGLSAEHGGELGIVYTPLHGTGRGPVERVLAAGGFGALYTVKEQAEPDTEFSTVTVPNPEDDGAWRLAYQLAEELLTAGKPVDLLLATDPDADRLGVCCRDGSGDFVRLSGNQVGVLLADYVLRQQRDNLPPDAVVVKSVVSSALADKLVRARGAKIVNVPVGFKYIGEQIKLLEEAGREQAFMFGFEESLGYLKGAYARDKDAVLAAALVAEAALYYKKAENRTLIDVLQGIYAEFGYYLDEQVAVTLSGQDGRARIEEILRLLKADRRERLGGVTVRGRQFYADGEQLIGGESKPLDFPKVDMLGVELADGGFIKVRPSGTEPKIRFYFCIAGRDRAAAERSFAAVREEFFRPVRQLLPAVY